MSSVNWHSLQWGLAVYEDRVLDTAEMNLAHFQALVAWEAWTSNRDAQHTESMINSMKTYLETAASINRHIRSQAWNGFGVSIMGNEARVVIYWLLALVYVLIGLFSAWTEDFPGMIEKPAAVYYYDIVIHLLTFLLEIAHGFCGGAESKWEWVWKFLSVGTCLGVRIGRAFLIAAKVQPLTPVITARDRFNAVGPGFLHGVKLAFGLMARPWTDIPFTGRGEPLEQVKDSGHGLSRVERRALLSAVQPSAY